MKIHQLLERIEHMSKEFLANLEATIAKIATKAPAGDPAALAKQISDAVTAATQPILDRVATLESSSAEHEQAFNDIVTKIEADDGDAATEIATNAAQAAADNNATNGTVTAAPAA